MPRHLNLRQIEAFKAVMEYETVSRGAEMLNITQPAMSKLIAHLEYATGLKLFDRVKGRLAPTAHALRLYEETARIFAGVRQVETAVEVIRREDQGQLAVGVTPALSGSFIQRAISGFLTQNPKVFCSVQSLASQGIVDWLVRGKLDIGLVSASIDNPYFMFESLMEQPLVCVMPLNHPLADKRRIKPGDLDQQSLITFNPESYARRRIERVLEAHDSHPEIVLVANVENTICEFVSAGLGISLVHPLMVSGLEDRLAVRPFEPDIMFSFQICRSVDTRNAQLVKAFADELRATSDQIMLSILSDS
jgi:DNA-binding transcriptional LysR family regulator